MASNQRIGVNQTQYVVNSQPRLSQVLVKTEADGTQTYYVYGLGLIGQEQGSEYLTYHFDFRGSTSALTDETGIVTERFQYSPYGLLVSDTVPETPFLFNGMYGVMTDESGPYYMRARYYHPLIRQFVNMDVLLGTVANGQTLSQYAYVTGQPVSHIDPFGLAEMFHPGVLDAYGNPTASNDMPIYPEDLNRFLLFQSLFVPGVGEMFDADVLFGISKPSTGWNKLGAGSSLLLSVLTLGILPNYGAMKRVADGDLLRTRLNELLAKEGVDKSTMEFYIHGTTSKRVDDFELSLGKKFYATYSPETAAIFASRTVGREGGELGGVVVVIPREILEMFKRNKQVKERPIPDMPEHWEVIFFPGTADWIYGKGEVLPLPPDFFYE